MLFALVCVALYCVGLVVCYRRWRTPGVIANAIFMVAADVARGTWEWSRPHHVVFVRAPLNDWACYSLGVLPLIAVFTPAALVGLWTMRPNAGDGAPPTFRTQLGGVMLALAAAAIPAVLATLELGIMILGCDTL